jgi:hypothetical protein
MNTTSMLRPSRARRSVVCRPSGARASALLLALTLVGCADEVGLQGDAGVVGLDSGGVSRDAGAASDARVMGDAGPPPGVRIAPLPADLVAVPPGGEEILFLSAGVLTRIRPDGTGSASLGYRPVYGYGPTPNLWLWSELDADRAVGKAAVYAPGGEAVTRLLEARAVTDVFTSSEEGDQALIVGDVRTIGPAGSSTRTGSLLLVDAAGGRRVLLAGLTLGRWDTRTRQHVCAPQVELMSPARALAIVCPSPGSDTRELVTIDLVTGATTTVARDVVPFLRASGDRTYALFADRTLALHAVSPAGDRVVPLLESRSVLSIAFLDGPRMAYVTSSQDLMIVSWPTMIPTPHVVQGVTGIEEVSGDGAWLVFRQTRAPSGLRDLYLVSTATSAVGVPRVLAAEPDAYPGDDAFSEDEAWVHWFARADADFIGDVVVASTAGGEPRTVASRAWLVLNTALEDRVMVLMNARFAANGGRLLADLGVAWRDGREPARTLVQGLDTAAFELFPEGDRAVFRISDGAFPGLWVRTLE